MKPLELTQEHKDKLLEMANKLFPEIKWGFGNFPTTEIGADYTGLDYLDITHLNHKIPCIKPRYEIRNKDTTKLKVIKKSQDSPQYDKVQDGFVDNISEDQGFFTYLDNKVIQGDDYDTVYIEGIHWFEFCWKILNKICEKIKSPIEITKKVELFGLVCFNNFKSQHLVDYLYSEFLKLK